MIPPFWCSPRWCSSRHKSSVTVPGGQIVKFGDDTDWIRIAYLTLAPLLGTALGSTLFAVALSSRSGQSSTITGTLAGQVVMEGFMHWRISPWLRRLYPPAPWRLSQSGHRHRHSWRQQRDRFVDSQPGGAGLQLPSRCFRFYISPVLAKEKWANGRTAWVFNDRGLGQRHLDYPRGYLRSARFAQIRVARHRGRLTDKFPSHYGLSPIKTQFLPPWTGTSDRAIIEHVKNLAETPATTAAWCCCTWRTVGRRGLTAPMP